MRGRSLIVSDVVLIYERDRECRLLDSLFLVPPFKNYLLRDNEFYRSTHLKITNLIDQLSADPTVSR